MSVLQLTRMWGSSGKLSFTNASASNVSVAQFSDIRLPEACICSIYFDAQIMNGAGLINSLTLTMFVGLGRTNVKITKSWATQPTPGSPLQIVLPWHPAASIQATVEGSGTSFSTDPFEIALAIQVSPMVRIPLTGEPLEFGMALPGEADGADDALYEDLEENNPGAADVMREQQLNGEEPDSPDAFEAAVDRELEGADDYDEPRTIAIPADLQRSVQRLARKLGRPPRVSDLSPRQLQVLKQFRRESRS